MIPRILGGALLWGAVLAGGAPAAPAQQAAPAAAVRTSPQLDAYLRSVYPAGRPGAAVLVVRDGRVVHRAAYGLADVEARRPLTPDDVFHVASITKTFTAAAVLRLAESGALSLDDPVGRHFPGTPAAWAGIPVRRLLSHTSGIPDFADREDVTPSGSGYLHHDTILARAAALPLLGAPGEAFAYSNTGYLLLGKILERHTGRPWDEHLESTLYRPLGMRHTRYAGDPGPGLVPGYEERGGRVVRARTPAAIPYAAGATVSTVDDLARWVEALDGGRVVGAASRDRIFRRERMGDGTTAGYGLGWVLSEFGPREVAWHGGDIAGYSSMLLRVPEERLVVIVLANHQIGDGGRPFFVARRLAELALGEDWSPRARVAAAEVAPLAGTYRGAGGRTYVVDASGGKLYARDGNGGEPRELAAYSPTDFDDGMGGRLLFTRRAGDTAAELLLRPTLGREEVLRRIP